MKNKDSLKGRNFKNPFKEAEKIIHESYKDEEVKAKKAFIINGKDFADILRTFNCLSSTDFKKCFGEELGSHFFHKLTYMEGNIAKMIFQLDNENLEKLFVYCVRKMQGS